jgi:hypothetical protein
MLRRFVARRAPDGGKSAVDVDEKGFLYVVGGEDSTLAVLSTVRRFDGTSWITVAPMATTRDSQGVEVYSGLLYAVGGTNSGSFALSSVERYDGSAWSSSFAGANMVTARRNHGVAVYSGLLYAVGGANSGSASLSSVERYDGSAWSSAPANMVTARRDHGVAVYNGLLYAVGGDSGSGFLSSVERYNGSAWSSVASMVTARRDHDVAVYKGYLYAVGGEDNTGSPLSSVERYDSVTDTWSSSFAGANMVTARWNHGVAVYNGLLYAIGGRGTSGVVLSSVEVFNGTTWSSATSLPEALVGMGVAVYTK